MSYGWGNIFTKTVKTAPCPQPASGNLVYVGGSFTNIGGQARNNIAALDVTTGAATSWDPHTVNAGWVSSTIVRALAVNESTVYSGGTFTNIGGQPRNNIAALDASTGLATSWDPNSTGDVYALVVSRSTVYSGETFTNIGGQPRNYIAALDASTGAATSWDPNATGGTFLDGIYALAVNGNTVYAGGSFTNIGGQARNNIASLDATTGRATSWDPSATGGFMFTSVDALEVSGSTIYAGGMFTNIGGQSRNNIAALDTTTGAATSWDPKLQIPSGMNGSVSSLALTGSYIYAGGYFSGIGNEPISNFGRMKQ